MQVIDTSEGNMVVIQGIGMNPIVLPYVSEAIASIKLLLKTFTLQICLHGESEDKCCGFYSI